MQHPDRQLPASGGARNRLQYETSPYLLQHADNPVDWFPWSDEAFRKASDEDKPIFLSIGYSSCHWCHVMEDESFRDAQVASLLSASFVAIKVDREERPDVDQAYMAMAQAVTGHGGWPLTVIMTPDKVPFYLATYLPRQSVSGQVGLLQLLPYVSQHWEDADLRSEIIASGRNVVSATQSMMAPRGVDEGFPQDAAARAFSELAETFDAVYGGFGEAPKFPTPARLSFLLGYWRDTGSSRALGMVTKTLDAMRSGGIYDHLDSGFHRYSVDRRWGVPHFEKMLYDQSLLALAYLDAYLATGTPLYADTVRQVLGYVLRRLRSPEGAFHCAEDADTAEGEGAYYLWTLKEMSEVLDAPALRVVLASMGIRPDDNRLRGDRPFVLAFSNPPAVVAEALSMSPAEVGAVLQRASESLLAAREERVPVMVDDKVLADWNGTTISALARAGRALDLEELTQAAERAADFVITEMMSDNVLMHTYKGGKASVPGFLDDYASMAQGMLELYQSTHRVRHLRTAIHVAERMVELFWDAEQGGFNQIGRHGEELVVSVKPVYDGAQPSGNAVAGTVVAWLARLTERADLASVTERLFSTFGPMVNAMPGQYTSLLIAYRLHSGDVYLTDIVGSDESLATVSLLRAAGKLYAPTQFVLYAHGELDRRDLEELLPVARGHTTREGASVAYVCNRSMCLEPTGDPAVLRGLLG
jgi:uncharacterized protein